jgi:hypothetical protein
MTTHPMFRPIHLAGLFLSLLVTTLLAGCATAPRVEVDRDPQADFSRYATFGFHAPLGTDRPDATSTLLSQTLKQTARTELEALGYRYVEGEANDLEINFFVATREVVEGMTQPGVGVGIGYGRYHSHYRVWADYPAQRIRQYTEGTLHVDVVDTARRQLIWEGVVRDRLREGEFDRNEVRQAVAEVFEQFPAGGRAFD